MVEPYGYFKANTIHKIRRKKSLDWVYVTATSKNHLEERGMLTERGKSKDLGDRARSGSSASHYPNLPSRNSCLLSHIMHMLWNVPYFIPSKLAQAVPVCSVFVRCLTGTLIIMKVFFVAYLSPSRIISGQYLKLGPGNFLQNPCYVNIHCHLIIQQYTVYFSDTINK